MKRILKTRTFNRWLRKTLLTDTALLKAIDEMEQGLVDADLGGNIYKKRVALPGARKKREHPDADCDESPKSLVFYVRL